MDWLKDSLWLVWLGGALVAGLLELASLDFVLAMFAGGALAASASAALGASPVIQVIVFAGSSAALLLGVRPGLRRWAVRSVPQSKMGIEALPGKDSLVLTEVTETSGTVKLAGETWTARVVDVGTALQPGSQARVVRIDGAIAMVRAAPKAVPADPEPEHD